MQLVCMRREEVKFFPPSHAKEPGGKRIGRWHGMEIRSDHLKKCAIAGVCSSKVVGRKKKGLPREQKA